MLYHVMIFYLGFKPRLTRKPRIRQSHDGAKVS